MKCPKCGHNIEYKFAAYRITRMEGPRGEIHVAVFVGRFPLRLSVDDWYRLLASEDRIRSYIDENANALVDTPKGRNWK